MLSPSDQLRETEDANREAGEVAGSGTNAIVPRGAYVWFLLARAGRRGPLEPSGVVFIALLKRAPVHPVESDRSVPDGPRAGFFSRSAQGSCSALLDREVLHGRLAVPSRSVDAPNDERVPAGPQLCGGEPSARAGNQDLTAPE